MSNQSLISLAIIKTNWENKRDYIGNFVPFVAECIKESPHSAVSLPELQSGIQDKYGLKIPQGALNIILTRAKRRGFVEQAHGTYHRIDDALRNITLTKDRDDILRKYNELLSKIIDYVEDTYSQTWEYEKAENVLLLLLENYSAPILAAAVEGGPLPSPEPTNESDRYVISTFVLHLYERDTKGFAFLETLVKGFMLANALLYPDISRVRQHLDRVEIYFDTQFLLRALGFAGLSLKKPCKELLNLLYELNGNLCCFEHTVDETQGVLEAAANKLYEQDPRARSFEVFDHFYTTDIDPGHVELMIATLEKRLSSMRIQIKPKSKIVEELSIDESGLNSLLQETIGYHNDRTRQRDVDSISAIYRLRNGRFPPRLETCGSIFVTTNKALANATSRYFQQVNPEPHVPVCVSDNVLTTLMWLKSPTSMRDLPRKRMYADSYAALNPPDELWQLYLDEVEQLKDREEITPDDYHLLRYSTEARKLLMQNTCGSIEVYTEGTHSEVLARIKTNIKKEEREKRTVAERRAQKLEEEMQEQEIQRKQWVDSISTNIGYYLSKSIQYGVIGVLLIGAISTVPKPFSEIHKKMGSLIMSIVLSCVAAFGLANSIWGTSVISLTRKIEIKIADYIRSNLNRLLP